jgi:fused signal recognition particle receptor
MFKFLKKKLKVFEDKLEKELEAELAKEKPKNKEIKEGVKNTIPSVKQVKPIEEKKPESIEKEEVKVVPRLVEKPSEKEIKPIIPLIEKKKEIPIIKAEVKPPIDKKVDKLIKKDEETRRQKIERDRRKREEEIDKQIEKSIEAELEHTLRTRRSIEEVVKAEKKTTIAISDEKLDDLLWDLEIGLLESDVAYSVIESIKKDIKEELRHISIERGKIGDVVESVLKNAISHVLMSNELDFDEFIRNHDKPIVIMFIGVNGSGKTLSIGKIASMLKKKGYSSVMAAGDTFRAGAIEQLGIHADNVGVKIIKHGAGADPAAVAFDAIDHAKAKHKDVVLLDTAGRVQTNINLMDEMAKIKRVAKPDLIIFVGDALSGNDAVEQAKRFNEVCGIDGVILTKVDTDAKGGSALSVAYTIGKPLLFIGVGQRYEDQVPFDPQWMIDNIFGK